MVNKTHSGLDCLLCVIKALANIECDCNCAEGRISLQHGHHEVTVKTAVDPAAVFLSVKPIGTPVCVGSIDMVGYSLLPNGFVLYADIKSNAAEVCYFVEV